MGETAASAEWRQAGVWTNQDSVLFGVAFVCGRRRRLRWIGFADFEFELDSDTISITAEPGVSEAAIFDEFDRTPRAIVFQARGYESLHSSAAVIDHRAAVFCGLTHSGKSTLALALNRRGLSQLADDHVVFRVEDQRPIVLPLAYGRNIRPATRHHFNLSESSAHAESNVAPLHPIDIGALFSLEQDASHPRPFTITPVPAHEAFTRVLPHAYCFDSDDASESRRLTDAYLALVAHAPFFSVIYRPDFSALDALCDAVVRTIRGAHSAPVVEPDHGAPSIR